MYVGYIMHHTRQKITKMIGNMITTLTLWYYRKTYKNAYEKQHLEWSLNVDDDGTMIPRFSGGGDALLYGVGVERSTTHRRLRQNSATLGNSRQQVR